MNVLSRGIRNAFRNSTRTFSVAVILGLSIALALSMLLAHQAVNKKIDDIKASVGNTITISPAGFNPGSQANNSLSASDLSKVKALANVTNLTENLSDRLPTTGSQSFGGFGGGSSGGAASGSTTSLTSPVTLNNNGGGRVFINGGGSLPTNFSLPVSFIGTTDVTSINGSSIQIKTGKTIDTSQDNNQALVSSAMATKNNLSVGSTFTAYGTTLTVAGIYTGSTQGGSNTVVLSLPALQRLSGQSGAITNATATVDSLDDLSGTTATTKNLLGTSADVVSAQDQANETVQPLQSIQKVSLYSLIGAIIAGAVIIFLVMLMVVRERRREIGVLKAIGASNIRVVAQFMVEAVTLTLLAAVVGIIISLVAADPITNTLVNNSTSSSTTTAGRTGPGGPGGTTTRGNFGGGGNFVARGRGLGRVGSSLTNIHAAVGWGVLADGLGAALVIALVGSAVASLSISKVRPAEVLRTE